MPFPPPRVSVIMPARNTAPYLEAAVESVLTQTFRDFELLLINDGSTDGTGELCAKLARTDARIRVITTSGIGLVEIGNLGIAESRGELIARMDSDDLTVADRFQSSVDFLDAHPEIGLIGGWHQNMTVEGNPMGVKRFAIDHETIDQLNLRGKNQISNPTVMMRKDALVRAGGYQKYPCAEDIDLWLRMAEVTHLANLPRVMLYYRRHATSVSMSNYDRQIEQAGSASHDACLRRGIPCPFNRLNLPPSALALTWMHWHNGETLACSHQMVRATLSPRCWAYIGRKLISAIP